MRSTSTLIAHAQARLNPDTRMSQVHAQVDLGPYRSTYVSIILFFIVLVYNK